MKFDTHFFFNALVIINYFDKLIEESKFPFNQIGYVLSPFIDNLTTCQKGQLSDRIQVLKVSILLHKLLIELTKNNKHALRNMTSC